MHKCRASILFFFLLVAVQALAQPTETEEIIQQQRAAAHPRLLFLPYYSIEGKDATELFLVSKIMDPLELDLFALSRSGQQLHLGRETLRSSRGLRIDLRERLKALGAQWEAGAIRVDFVGDAKTLQAWSVVRSGSQTFEVPFVSQEKAANREYLSFWDTDLVGPRPKVTTEYFVTNTTAAPVPFTLSVYAHGAKGRMERGKLSAYETRPFVVSSGEATHRGWLRFTHDGPAQAVIGHGLLSSGAKLSYIPLLPLADTRKGPNFEILRLPDHETGDRPKAAVHAALSLFNPADTPQTVFVDAVDQASGVPVATQSLNVDAWSVERVNVKKLLGGALTPGLRLRVRASSENFAVQGASVSSGGEVLDMSVHAATTAHKTGTYPIPDLDRYAVRTTIINIGDEDAEIIGQYFWDGGTVSIPLTRIAPGAAIVLDPNRLAADGTTDFLKRKLDPNGRNLALKWSLRKGSDQLIGRTEARPIDGVDNFGFNCGGCCWEIPFGGIEPGEVELGLGEFPSFEPTIWWDTCTGTIGPYAASPESNVTPSPFSWNYSQLSTSGGADSDISFDQMEIKTGVTCAWSWKRVRGWGRGKACNKVYNPNDYDENQQCSTQTSNCSACNSCCLALYNVKVCRGGDPDGLPLSERQACEGVCLTDRCV